MNSKLRMLTAPFRVFPDFIILGEAKCGTTSLYRYLNQLPVILGADVKEPNNFREYGGSPLFCKQHFPTYATLAYHQARHGAVRVGEASAEYFSKPNLPKTIHGLLPDVRLICLFRDPVKRAYSDWQMLTRANREHRPFEEIVDHSLTFLSNPDHEVVLEALDHLEYHPLRYVARGLYHRALIRWMNTFSPDRILCLLSEDLFSDPADTLQRVTAFLGVQAECDSLEFSPRKQGNYDSPCPESCKQELAAFYKPWNQKLSDATDLDLPWKLDA